MDPVPTAPAAEPTPATSPTASTPSASPSPAASTPPASSPAPRASDAPAADAPTKAADAPSKKPFDAAAFFDEGEPVKPPEVPAAKPPAAAVAQPATPPLQGPQPVVSATPVAVPAAPVEAQPAAAAPAAPAAPTGPTPADLATMRKGLVDTLSKNYALDENTAQAMLVEPEKHIPSMLANLHIAIYEDVAKLVMRQMPYLIRETGITTERSQKAEQAFFDRWPKLKGHEQDVARTLQLYRQQNPTTPMQDAIAQVGAMVMLMKGLAVDADTSAPLATAGPTVPPPRPFVPVPAGGGGPSPVNAPSNRWGDLAQQFAVE